MKTKFDFSTKELIQSFSYSTMTRARFKSQCVKIAGRDYIKYGDEQAITFVGNLYQDHNYNRILCIGVARQHPYDVKCDKQLAYETAAMKAMTDPDIVMYTAPKKITRYNFNRMMEWYKDMFDLDMIKTKQEIINAGKNPADYNR